MFLDHLSSAINQWDVLASWIERCDVINLSQTSFSLRSNDAGQTEESNNKVVRSKFHGPSDNLLDDRSFHYLPWNRQFSLDLLSGMFPSSAHSTIKRTSISGKLQFIPLTTAPKWMIRRSNFSQTINNLRYKAGSGDRRWIVRCPHGLNTHWSRPLEVYSSLVWVSENCELILES